jgi:hypothetical protein
MVHHFCSCKTIFLSGFGYLINTSSIALISLKSDRNSVDSDKFRPLEFGDAIATLTNKTKPTGPSCRLGGFVVSTENLSTH